MGPCDVNYSPFVDIDASGNVSVVWVGKKYAGYTNMVMQRTKPVNGNWSSVFKSYDNSSAYSYTISSPQTIMQSTSYFIVGWQKNNVSRYNITPSATIKNFSLPAGNGVQLVERSASDFRGMGLSTGNQPYAFKLSSQAAMYKDNVITKTGREGSAYLDSVSFFFALGDVMLDGSNVLFPAIPDSILFASARDLNRVLETDEFQLSDNSQLEFTVSYGIDNPEKAKQILTEKDKVNFRVELVDAGSGKVLGLYDEVGYTRDNLKEYTNISYRVNTEGINNKKVKLRLITGIEGNSVKGFSVTDILTGEEGLAKKDAQTTEIGFKGTLTIDSYALEQNYPNPFNPSTIIKYQIPQAGHVSLKVFDILGKEVTTLVNETKDTGRYEVKFNASNLASGVYIYRLQAGEYTATHKMLMIK